MDNYNVEKNVKKEDYNTVDLNTLIQLGNEGISYIIGDGRIQGIVRE